LIPTESLQKVKVEGVVESTVEVSEEPIKEVRVADLEEIEVVEVPVTVTGVKSTVSPTNTKPELVEVTVVGKPSKVSTTVKSNTVF
jgi:hypothetical protein